MSSPSLFATTDDVFGVEVGVNEDVNDEAIDGAEDNTDDMVNTAAGGPVTLANGQVTADTITTGSIGASNISIGSHSLKYPTVIAIDIYCYKGSPDGGNPPARTLSEVNKLFQGVYLEVEVVNGALLLTFLSYTRFVILTIPRSSPIILAPPSSFPIGTTVNMVTNTTIDFNLLGYINQVLGTNIGVPPCSEMCVAGDILAIIGGGGDPPHGTITNPRAAFYWISDITDSDFIKDGCFKLCFNGRMEIHGAPFASGFGWDGPGDYAINTGAKCLLAHPVPLGVPADCS